jgi:hypothetical protein
MVVVLKRTHRNHKETISTLKRGLKCEIQWQTRSVRVLVRNVRTDCPEYPDVYPECPGYCFRSAKQVWSGVSGPICPEYPDKYPEFPGTALPTASFWERGYKYSHTPSHSLPLLLIFDQNCRKPKESSLTPHLLHSWVIFVGVWSKIVQVSFDFISWAHQSKSSPWILVYYSWSSKLLDG